MYRAPTMAGIKVIEGWGRRTMAEKNQVRESVLQAIGNTPVVRLRKLVTPGMAEVLVKLEYYNPTGSYKDRMALAASPRRGPDRRAGCALRGALRFSGQAG